MELATNTVLQDRYLIVRLIGKGGMGAVYEAKDQRLGHPVALKQTIVTGPQLLQAFEREARILARLRHPALPVVSDYFSESSGQFLVMQYIPGDDLGALLEQRGAPFPVAQVLEWGKQLLDALQYLHSHNPPIIHRDIKPSNIKLSPRGDVILLDFGLSKGGKTNNTRLSISGKSLYGYTPHYAPLEQIEGEGTDQRSDLYSLAVTLHHLLTGTVPATAVSRASAQIHQELDPLRPANQLNPQVPMAIANVLTQTMALNRTQRPSSAFAMRAMLKNSAPRATNLVPNVPLYNSQAATVAESLEMPPPFKPEVHHTPSPAVSAEKKAEPAKKITPQGSLYERLRKIIKYTLIIILVLMILFFGLTTIVGIQRGEIPVIIFFIIVEIGLFSTLKLILNKL